MMRRVDLRHARDPGQGRILHYLVTPDRLGGLHYRALTPALFPMSSVIISRFRILALGGLSVELGGGPLPALVSHRKTLALLALLAADGDAGVSRDRVVGLLW